MYKYKYICLYIIRSCVLLHNGKSKFNYLLKNSMIPSLSIAHNSNCSVYHISVALKATTEAFH